MSGLIVIPKRACPVIQRSMTHSEFTMMCSNSNALSQIAQDINLFDRWIAAAELAPQYMVPSEIDCALGSLVRVRSEFSGTLTRCRLDQLSSAANSILNKCISFGDRMSLDDAIDTLKTLCMGGIRSELAVKALFKVFIRNVDIAEADHVVTVINTFTRLNLSSKGDADVDTTLQETLSAAIPRLTSLLHLLSPYQSASALNALSHLTPLPAALLSAGGRVLPPRLGADWSGRDVALTLNALVTSSNRPLALLRAAEEWGKKFPGALGVHETALVLNAFVRADYPGGAVAAAWVDLGLWKSELGDSNRPPPQTLALLLHGLARITPTLPPIPGEFLSGIAKASLSLLPEFTGQGISMFIGGLATLSKGSLKALDQEGCSTVWFTDPLLAEIYKRSVTLCGKTLNPKTMNFQDVGVVAKGLSQLRLLDGRLFTALIDNAAKSLPALGNPLGTTNSVDIDGHALTTLLISLPKDLSVSEGRGRWIGNAVKIASGKVATADLTQLAKAAVKAGVKDRNVWREILKSGEERLLNFSANNLATFLLAIGQGQIKIPSVFTHKAVKQFCANNVLEISSLLDISRACRILRIGDFQIWERLAIAAVRLGRESMSESKSGIALIQFITNMVHSLRGDHGQVECGRLLKDLPKLLSGKDVSEISKFLALGEAADLFTISEVSPGLPERLIADLFQGDAENNAILALYLKSSHPSLFSALPETVREGLAKSVTLGVKNHKISTFHKEVSRLLTKIGKPHVCEVALGPLSIDIMLTCSGGNNSNLLIEVDGPSHFYDDTGRRTNESILKHKILNGLGFRVLRISHKDWLNLHATSEKIQFLKKLFFHNEAE